MIFPSPRCVFLWLSFLYLHTGSHSFAHFLHLFFVLTFALSGTLIFSPFLKFCHPRPPATFLHQFTLLSLLFGLSAVSSPLSLSFSSYILSMIVSNISFNMCFPLSHICSPFLLSLWPSSSPLLIIHLLHFYFQSMSIN